jgi:pimeloyl-ACP methyl ester carboxylesterase
VSDTQEAAREVAEADDAPLPEAGQAGRLSRRRVLWLGAGGLAVAAAAVTYELVERRVIPAKLIYDDITGTCSVSEPSPLTYSRVGPQVSGSFFSSARGRRVGYTIGYPTGHGPGDELPLVIMLHGFGGNHTNALSGLQPAQAVSLHVDGRPMKPMALVTVDGGGGYWNPHPTDDLMRMLVDELVPRCQSMGLGRPPHRIGTMGISMGGYGALLVAEKHPDLVSAVAAISPAVWTSYRQARAVNRGAYASPADFVANDVVTHASALDGMPVRIASGDSDPFHPGVEALARVVPAETTVVFSSGCHTGPFFNEQEPPSLAFLAEHLTR